jgi:hypothetical protein
VTVATLPDIQNQPRRLGRSTAAIAIGFISVAVLSLGTHQILHVLTPAYGSAACSNRPRRHPRRDDGSSCP